MFAMTTTTNYEKDIETYIKDAVTGENKLSFNKFLRDNVQLTVKNTTKAQWGSFENVWRARVANVAKELNIEMDKEDMDTTIFFEIFELYTRESPKAKPSSASSSYVIASKTDSYEITEDAKLEYRKKFEAMDDGNKWELREGVFVEDIMYEYGKNCTHEHAAHSFILNTSDPCWENVFSKEDFKKICTEGNYRLPKLDDNIIDMFAHYHDSPETNVLDFIIKKSKDLGPFDPRYEVDQYKLLHVIQQFIGYYVDNTMANITMWTEQDFVAHIWCVLDRFFQSSGITTTRNKTCLATAQRMNGNRCVTGDSEINKKLRSTQPDLVLLKNGVEYGTSEVGKSIDIVAGKKEIVESQLHSPKTMHDMLCAAHERMNNDFNSVRDLKIVCFNETGLTLYLSIMDCPKGYVSRIIETQKYEVPKDSDLIIGQLFPLLKLILHAKKIVDNSLAVVKKNLSQEQEPGLAFENDSRKLNLPSSLTSILPKKRKKNSDESSTSSTPSSKRKTSNPLSTTS